MSGASSEAVFDPTIPAAQQKVTYQAKDGTIKTVTKAELQDQLETSEKLMESLNETWEEKMQRTQEVQREREKALEELGITVEKNNVGVHTPKRMPHLVNLVSLSSSILYVTLKLTSFGNVERRSTDERVSYLSAQVGENRHRKDGQRQAGYYSSQWCEYRRGALLLREQRWQSHALCPQRCCDGQ